ncbi:hypothetical protein SAMN05428967_2551 [Phyllobacterium sp. YR620]|uniref:Phage portal protein n=1 Tax=Phyllobacterium pellucidum TaxID=2740464 RepID=A0A849VL24_9HYPH|nr:MULTISPECIES: hypothetical protein [Phyllobacterium]NTS29996.1 hypothetical protein [Phyllobacterium pellucidum]UGY08193.1 hypothetical protein LLE51_008930 [Phyllobacterium sp. T1018]SDP57752.1 hypothetical protein SAMN05428967_2551 [Phyllobacterium sp. YR620]SFI48870.1 hypothetical protein SAMN04515648_0114 [Phyllobacterium sp. CL33Tsu]
MARLSPLLAVGFAVSVVLSSGIPVRAADYVQGGYDDTCGQASVLNRIVNRFAYQVRHVPNLPQVGIQNFSDVRMTRFEPSREPELAAVERHYCKATAHLSDGVQRPVWYVVEDGMGFVGIGNNVEFCVAGFDRWHVYDGQCRTLY